MNKKIIVIISTVLIVILLVGSLIFWKNNKEESTNYPLIYMNDRKELVVADINNHKRVIDKFDYNARLDIVYTNLSDQYLLYLNDNKLKLYDNTKDRDAKILNERVFNTYGFTKNDKYAYYIDMDGKLYINNFKKEILIDEGVASVYFALEDCILYEKSGSLYIKGYKDDETIKVVDYIGPAYLGKDHKKVLLGTTNNELYLYNIEDKTRHLVSKSYYEIVTFTPNLETIYYTSTSSNDFIDRYEQLNKEQLKIVEYLKEETLNDKSIYVYESENTKELVKNIDLLLGSDIDAKSFVYLKTDKTILDISEYKSLKKFKKDYKKLEKKLMYFKDSEEVIGSGDNIVSAFLDRNNLYYLVGNDDKENTLYTLNYLDLDNKDEVVELDKNLAYSTLEEVLNGVFYYLSDYSVNDKTGSLKVLKDGITMDVGNNALLNTIQVNEEQNKVYYLADLVSNNGNLYYISEDSINKVVGDVSGYIHVKDNCIYLLKNYNEENDTYDVYLYNGKEEVLVDKNVKGIASTLLYVKNFNS